MSFFKSVWPTALVSNMLNQKQVAYWQRALTAFGFSYHIASPFRL